jgi:hypothetical protein
MSSLKVEAISISQLLESLKTCSWLVPIFQRDFVWSETDVANLVQSIIEARPIGMATLWEQPDDTALELEPINIPDSGGPEQPPLAKISTLGRDNWPKKFYAILDGRQRCTAVAMAFGGLRASNPRRRFSGRFFLDVTAHDLSDRIKYFREPELRSKGLVTETSCISAGLFPLASFLEGEDLFGQWMRYLQLINTPSNYPGNQLPEQEELERRNKILKAAFHGINTTLLAVYVVPPTYALGDICEIFETLNTSGTKVSTVDLLHSWLYSDTSQQSSPIYLREWIDELGQTEGGIGWASRDERPELVAQLVTACYVALELPKAEPRPVGRRRTTSVTSIKAGDLLATPYAVWLAAIRRKDDLASYIRDFQLAVAGGRFPLKWCPYPATLTIYGSLRWYMDVEPIFRGHWTVIELNALFRAFFWRNALTSRYDQGFLTQSAADLRELKSILYSRNSCANSNVWAEGASELLEKLIDRPMPSIDQLVDRLTDSRPKGAFGQALVLAMLARANADFIDPNIDLRFPTGNTSELHHIYPRDWAKNNQYGALHAVLNARAASRNYVESVSNLVPLSRESNSWWSARSPGQALAQKALSYSAARTNLSVLYIDEQAFEVLLADPPDPKSFWERRAHLIAHDLVRLTNVELGV